MRRRASKRFSNCQAIAWRAKASTFSRATTRAACGLQMDYLKPELLLRKHHVVRTIVVFGSTRICEPAEARRKVAALRAALITDGSDRELARRLAIAERVLAKSHYYDVARDFGRLVGQANSDQENGQTLVMTGGGPGIMEARTGGGFDANARTIGLNISLPHEQYPNPYVTTELCFELHYFALRKLHFLQRAKALGRVSRRLRHI